MAKDAKKDDGPDPKDIQKTSKDFGKTLSDLMEMHREQGKVLEDADKLNDQIMKDTQKDAEKQQMERWKLMQDTQTKIMDVMQEVTKQKSKVEKSSKAWDEYIRG